MEKKIKAVEFIVIVLFCSAILSQFIVDNVCYKAEVEGSSMEPSFYDGDKIFVLRHGEIQSGKILIAVDNTTGNRIIKRCIGLPGDTVKASGGCLYINGKKVKENYTKGITNDFDEIKVEEGSYFLMGDNRENSKDSRIIGCIKKKDILGIVYVKKEK